ncbi:hypothetical protein FQN53_000089 [Emmonsiellopsis sp. PD_33]|nr:hypothetical protein FQN53_000089 [Emmonsiellopsis sp. PD_33]
MLLNTPVEIIHLIIQQLSAKRDLSSLSLVSWCMHRLVVPFLYRSIVIRSKDTFLDNLFVEPFFRTCCDGTSHLEYVKHVRVYTAFHTKDHEGDCPHQAWENGERRFGNLKTHLLPLLERLEDQSLEGFSWELGCCVPEEILSARGYLNKKQSSIRTLSLMTLGQCRENRYDECVVDFAAFRSLHDFSWSGIATENDLAALDEVLANNSPHLRRLCLNPKTWANDYPWDGLMYGLKGYYSAHNLLKLSSAQPLMFPALESLSLTRVHFAENPADIAAALNFPRLRSLALLYCSRVTDLLMAATEMLSDGSLRLKSFSLHEYIGTNHPCREDSLLSFIRASAGLEDLHLSPLNMGYDKLLALWRDLVDQHRSTLTRLAVHRRDELSSIAPMEEEDIFPGDLFPGDLVAELDLEILSLLSTIPSLPEIRPPYRSSNTLRVLHLHVPNAALVAGLSARDLRGSYPMPEDSEPISNFGISNILAYCPIDPASLRHPVCTIPSIPVYSPPNDAYVDIVQGIYSFVQAMYSFAHWTFGPQGLLSLQVLVIGNYDHHNRLRNFLPLLCRNELFDPEQEQEQAGGDLVPSFRGIRMGGDKEIWDLVEKHADFMDLCTTCGMAEGFGNSTSADGRVLGNPDPDTSTDLVNDY